MCAAIRPRGKVLWILACLFALLCACSFFFGFYLLLAQAPGEELILPFVVAGVAAVAGIGFTFGAILKRTEAKGDEILFDTWFPLFMAMVPVAGPFIALWSVIKLLRGRLGGKNLRGSGLPGALILLVMASLQPVLIVSLSLPEEMAASLGISPRENVWDGSSELVCDRSQVFRMQGATVRVDKVQLTMGCQLHIVDSRLTLAQGIEVKDRARLTIRGGRLESEGLGIDTRDQAQVQLESTTLLAPNSIRAQGESTVFVRDGMIHGKTALSAADHAVITLRKVERLGKVETTGVAIIHELQEGESEEDIVRRARGQKAVAESREEHVERYHQEACKGFVECYQRHQVRGEISGHLEMVVGAEGKVIQVTTREIGRTTPEVSQCIEALSESKTLPDFAGPTGTLSCSYAGTVTPESRMLDMSSRFTPDEGSGIHLEKPK